MRESKFKSWFKGEVKSRISHVRMYEPKTWKRGDPDLIILGLCMWAALEFKKEEGADRQPNQEYKTDYLNSIGYARFVEPENAEEVLDDLERLL